MFFFFAWRRIAAPSMVGMQTLQKRWESSIAMWLGKYVQLPDPPRLNVNAGWSCCLLRLALLCIAPGLYLICSWSITWKIPPWPIVPHSNDTVTWEGCATSCTFTYEGETFSGALNHTPVGVHTMHQSTPTLHVENDRVQCSRVKQILLLSINNISHVTFAYIYAFH